MQQRTFFTVLLYFTIVINIYAQSSESSYEVGTWHGFCNAAVTYTFDDLCSKQIPVAVPLLDKFNFKATFNPIINTNPNWSKLKKLAENGHEIGSHTMSHSDNIKGMSTEEDELKNSKIEIEEQIPECKCITIAYPYCKPLTETLVSKHYIAGRSCQGRIESKTPDFMDISSIAVGSETSLKTALDINAKVNEAATSNGWCVFLIHGIDNDGGYSPIASSVLEENIEYVNDNKSMFWVSTFSDVVRYIKERDAIKIKEISALDQSITLSVKDNLVDSVYNYPVTIRRELPSRWKSASVSQKGIQLVSSIVTVGLKSYVMFDVVPDNGDITISEENAPVNNFVSKYGALKRNGSKIVGANGDPVQVAGPSLYWSIWGGEKFYNNNVISTVVTSWNATLVRAAIAVEFDGGYLKKPTKQVEYAKAAVDAAIENGIYILVDWHDHNANLHIPEAKEFFAEMSETYKNIPNIIWEIWNEPDNENGTGKNGYDTWEDVSNYADSIIPVIRKNSSNLIVVGTPNWSADPASAAKKPLSDENVAYTLHFYSGTHGAAVRANADTALNRGAAVFITEFGTINTVNVKTDTTLYLDEAKTWLDWADFNGISWANWSLSNIPEACSELISSASTTGNWSNSDLSRSGKWVRDRLLARPANQNSDMVRIIAFNEGNGSVNISPNANQVKKGTEVIFAAVPADGWEFKAWNGASNSTKNPLKLKIMENTSLVATFVPGVGTNMVKSGDFTDATQWSVWVDEKDNDAEVTFEDEQANVEISKSDTVNWKIQVSQSGLALDSGVTLILSFDAWSSAERKLFAGLSTAVTYHFQGGGEVQLNDKKKTFSIEVTPDSSTYEGIVSFSCGNSVLPVYIDNVFLVKKNGSPVKKYNGHKKNFVQFKHNGDRIYWTALTKNTKVMITDICGRIIQPETIANPVSLTKTSKGVYLFIAKDDIQKKVFHIVR